MREIKFRGKDMGGHWVYGLLTKKKIRNSGEISYAIAQGNYSMADTIPVNEKSIGEYTGCRDKNGVEIYEGDIVLVHFPFGKIKYEVKREAGGFTLKANEIEETLKKNQFEIKMFENMPFAITRANEQYEIIGNIFEKQVFK